MALAKMVDDTTARRTNDWVGAIPLKVEEDVFGEKVRTAYEKGWEVNAKCILRVLAQTTRQTDERSIREKELRSRLNLCHDQVVWDGKLGGTAYADRVWHTTYNSGILEIACRVHTGHPVSITIRWLAGAGALFDIATTDHYLGLGSESNWRSLASRELKGSTPPNPEACYNEYIKLRQTSEPIRIVKLSIDCAVVKTPKLIDSIIFHYVSVPPTLMRVNKPRGFDDLSAMALDLDEIANPDTQHPINIWVMGHAGHGKSSAVNTCLTACHGNRKVFPYVVRSAFAHSATSFIAPSVKRYPLAKNVFLYDAWGWSSNEYKGELLGHLFNGNLQSNFRRDGDAKSGTSGWLDAPTENDQPHAVIVVVSATEFELHPESTSLTEFQRFRMEIERVAKRRLIVALTKLDILDARARNMSVGKISKHPHTLFSSRFVAQFIQSFSTLTNIPLAHIAPIKPYCEEHVRNAYTDALTTHLLALAVRLARTFRKMPDPVIPESKRTKLVGPPNLAAEELGLSKFVNLLDSLPVRTYPLPSLVRSEGLVPYSESEYRLFMESQSSALGELSGRARLRLVTPTNAAHSSVTATEIGSFVIAECAFIAAPQYKALVKLVMLCKYLCDQFGLACRCESDPTTGHCWNVVTVSQDGKRYVAVVDLSKSVAQLHPVQSLSAYNYTLPSVMALRPLALTSIPFGEFTAPLEVLARTKFSVARKTVWRGKVVVLKELIDMPEITDREFKLEVGIQASFSHPNVLPVLAACDNGPPAASAAIGTRFAIITEWMTGGNLHSFVESSTDQLLPLAERLRLLLEIADAIHVLHAHNIVHRDLKPGNILVSGTKPCPHIKLCDFGLSRGLSSNNSVQTSCLNTGTPQFMAPEQVSPDAERLTRAIDVYAFGGVMFELVYNEQPWSKLAHNPLAIITSIMQSKLPPPPASFDAKSAHSETNSVIEVMHRCFTKDPAKRPDITEVREDLISIFNRVRKPAAVVFQQLTI